MEAAGRALAVTFPWHGWPRADLLALAGMAAGVAAVVIAMVPPVSRALRRAFGTAVLRADFPWRRYARWFARTWGVYDNPYLRDREYLNLGDTYVPLSIRAAVTGAETVTDATAVLADDRAGNLVILGDPGSGKSTLLKAHGVGALTGRHAAPMARPRPVVPFFVQLRKLAGTEGQISIFDYLAAEILESGAGMSSSAARRFLRYALRQGQVEVMLDGLDEVPSHRRRAVLQAVAYFKDDKSPDRMSCRARIMITCRQQNFESLQEERQEWLSATDGRECWLMRLGDAQIYSYLDKHRGKFTPPGDPDSFFEAIRASGTLSLHRAPLILAMSVGMYAPRAHFLMPSSMAEFYRKMIRDMLDRRGIRYDPGGAMPLNFHTSDPRLVEPLWRCLAAPGIENFGGCATIVRRLVDLATSPDGFAELARQPPRTRSFLTGDARRRAYPFRRGLPNDHNLVTLLTWANQVRVVPARPNRYFEAKAAGHLDRIETARRRAISFAPFWAVRIFSVALCLGALIAAVVFVATDPGALAHSRFGGARLIAVIPGAAILPMFVFAAVSAPADDMSYDSRLRQFLIFDAKGEYGDTETASVLEWIPSFWLIVAMTVVIAVALLPLAKHSWIAYFTADAVIGFLYFAPFMNGFSRGRRYYLYKPSPYIDLYDDPRSRHWVSPDQAY